MKPILEIKNITKKYRISHERRPYLSLRDSLSGLLKSNGSSTEDFYALKDVTFDVMPGDTVGIIGKNGAGKSTLLKIISRITPPTSGSIIGRGRIASLLEVGTGFHPELSGRENIYFNGSILGMKRKEIERNFDAIVDFSGVEKFIDTPLKHYSSGMQLRLAFAVAAFLENEILIIDEVLAVGDAEFQKKCLGKMDEVSKSGRTVLFVSHQIPALRSLCRKGIILKNGELQVNDKIENAIQLYEKSSARSLCFNSASSKSILVNKIEINSSFIEEDKIDLNSPIEITFQVKASHFPETAQLGFSIRTNKDQRIIAQYIKLEKNEWKNEIITKSIRIEGGVFPPEIYFVSAGLVIPNIENLDIIEDACSFEIIDNSSTLLNASGIQYGSVITNFPWK